MIDKEFKDSVTIVRGVPKLTQKQIELCNKAAERIMNEGITLEDVMKMTQQEREELAKLMLSTQEAYESLVKECLK